MRRGCKMTFRALSIRPNGKQKLHVKLGYKTAKITVEIPVKRLAIQAVRAAFGPKARIVGGRHD